MADRNQARAAGLNCAKLQASVQLIEKLNRLKSAGSISEQEYARLRGQQLDFDNEPRLSR